MLQAKFDAAMAQKKLLEDDATATQVRGPFLSVADFLRSEEAFIDAGARLAPCSPSATFLTNTFLAQGRMDAANALLGALAGEEERWTRQSREFDDTIQRLTGAMQRAYHRCQLPIQTGPLAGTAAPVHAALWSISISDNTWLARSRHAQSRQLEGLKSLKQTTGVQ